MKVLAVIAILVVVHGAAALPYIVGTGASSVYNGQDGVGNYNFGYTEGHGTGATFRKESGSPGVKVGSYGLTDADGRQRIVNYIADAAGFRANIQTNEPGVDASKDPADASINKVAAAVVAAPIHYGWNVPHFSYGYTF